MEEITLFAFCLLFLYSFHTNIEFYLFQFPYLSSFPLLLQQSPHSTMFPCLHGPLDNPHMTCALSVIIFFICCQCASHLSISTLFPLPYLWPYFCMPYVFSSLSFYTRTVGLNFLCHLFVVLSHLSITNNLCFGTHSSFWMTLMLWTLAFVPLFPPLLPYHNIVNHIFNRTSYMSPVGFLLHEQSVSDV